MAVKIEGDQIYLAVRDLVKGVQPGISVSSFPLPQRGLLGRKAQQDLQAKKNRRFGLFHSEYQVQQSFPFQKYMFHIRGRIDGVYQLKERFEIEEIKSVILSAPEFRRLDISLFPHFIDQALIYAYLLQSAERGTEVKPFLVLVNLINDVTRTFPIDYHRELVEAKLFRRFAEIIEQICIEQERQEQFRKKFDKAKLTLPERRKQQDEFMRIWTNCLNQNHHLMVSAPTGTGKTAAALFPALSYALSHGKRVFFVTSKTTQQEIVRQTLKFLLNDDISIKALFLRASEKMCVNDIYFCHEAYCPYARNYHDRLLNSNILNTLLDQPLILPDNVKKKAAEEQFCPFDILLDLSLHVDLIVGDYNYVFDPTVFIRRLFSKKDISNWVLIIDEAHNLYARGMQYLSPQLRRSPITDLINLHSNKRGAVYRKLVNALNGIEKLLNDLQTEGEIHHEERQYFITHLDINTWSDAISLYEAAFIKYLIHKVKKQQIIINDPLETLYYSLRRLIQVARIEDPGFFTFFNADDGGCLQIECCDPSGYLGERIDQFHSVLAMSATLDPMGFYREVLGFKEERTENLQLDSPFPTRNRKIFIIPSISTRLKDRHKHYVKIAEIIKKIILIRKGNYLVFFPSFEYLQNVNLFLGNLPGDKLLQRPGMSEKDRETFLNRLKEDDGCLLLGVMGGIFSEGVDYPGKSAIGVMVVSPALPAVTYERELLKKYYDEKNGLGMEYAYTYPGMNKVIQSVGRLIRSSLDTGIVVLIGERFSRDEYNSILPDYWFDPRQSIHIGNDYMRQIRKFWSGVLNN